MRRLCIALVPVLSLLGTPAGAQNIEALEKQLEDLRNAAPMEIKPFMAVKRAPQYFGDYEPRADNVYKRGEELLFYGEPKNLMLQKDAKGVYQPAFDVDVEIKGPGDASMKKDKFMTFKLPTRSRVQDIFLNLTLSLGQAPAGKYNVKFTVRDLNSKKVASAASDIVLK
ncbi:MAG TPA: hypothetical protein VM073_09130 [Usitatibacter sp.]|nr:hypothetical protein [Usitatibacter sp.]